METENVLSQHIDEAAQALRAITGPETPEALLILGSGLNHFAERIEEPACLPFAEVPHMGTSSAEGHVGRFVAGRVAGRRVLCMQGRLHGYEGYAAEQVALPVWAAARLGVGTLITTNAAGAINAAWKPGEFCLMVDHINLTGRNPVANMDASRMAERFFSMCDAYDPALRAAALEAAAEAGVPLHEGVYLGLLGPSFETPAEIRAFRTLGADTVAMSVCEEVIAARHAGMRVAGISLLLNMAAGMEAPGSEVDPQAVARVEALAAPRFCALIEGLVKRL